MNTRAFIARYDRLPPEWLELPQEVQPHVNYKNIQNIQNMKTWYNKDRTKCLNLDNISYWEYIDDKYIHVWVAGGLIPFEEDESKELYKILTSKKELL
jgi:uncharacterized protein with NAD-binding domain and iron-sulfur cluster